MQELFIVPPMTMKFSLRSPVPSLWLENPYIGIFGDCDNLSSHGKRTFALQPYFSYHWVRN